MKYLVDTSALIRIHRHQADPVWREVARRGLIMLCEPVLAEAMHVADDRRHAETEAEFHDTYIVTTVPDRVWNVMGGIRHELVGNGVFRGVSLVDQLVAATAIILRLEVLHEDHDFETVARYVPELRQRRLSAGVA
ncbi:PIN domain-containing protein [Dactylosporangium sp. CS-047395]|uniref:PIN domain-containing protein n=1 Tax=Dactylosporangium sp. CS-047395 TaxID=3239936 RepID=UPI003D944032